MKMKLYPYKCFFVNDKYYVFSSGKNQLLEIEKTRYEKLLKAEKENFMLETEDKKFISECERFFLVDNNIELKYEDNQEVYNLVLMVEQGCNLNCTYCYGESGEYNNKGKMTFKVAKDAVDFLIKHCGTRKSVYIIFFGGEPLLNLKLIREIVEYAEKLQEDTGIYIGKSMTTNGTLLTEEITEYCLEKKIGIKISIDGPEEINDRCRCYKDGRGSYQDILKNTYKLRKEGMISARATVTPFCLDENYIENSLKKEGFVNVGSAFATELLSDEDYLRIYKHYTDDFEYIKDLVRNEKYQEIKEKHIRYWGYLFLIHKSVMSQFNCGTGRNMYAVDINGDLYPCQRFVGKQEYKLGDIYNGASGRKDFLDKIEVNSKFRKKCSKCWIKNLCLGKCPYTALVATGKVYEQSDIVCTLEKALYENAICFYSQLSEKEKKLIFA